MDLRPSFEGFPLLPSLTDAGFGQKCVVIRGRLPVDQHGLATVIMNLIMEPNPSQVRAWRAFTTTELTESIYAHPVHSKNADAILLLYRKLVAEEQLIEVVDSPVSGQAAQTHVFVTSIYASYLAKLEKFFY